ncbi:MAG: C45 family peptidase [Chloroflexota bacterium]
MSSTPSAPATRSAAVFPRFRLAGSHRQIGRQFGEATSDLIRLHLERALGRLEAHSSLSRADALAAAMQYRPYVQQFAPYLDEEVVGVAEGAGLKLDEAYLLQLRAEAASPPTAPAAPLGGATGSTNGHAQPRLTADDDAGDECTSVAVLPEATGQAYPDGGGGDALIAHNSDLPAFYREVSVVLEIVPDDAPAVLMLTPAGQVSYIGLNDAGLAVVANYLTCDGWRVGFPRYLLSRVALTHASVDDAIAAIRAIPRASSRNLLMLDAHGTAADLETTPTRDARLDPEDGILAHANHYVAPSLLEEERTGDYIHNSSTRMNRIRELAEGLRGTLDVPTAQQLLQDRACYPDALCREPADSPTRDVMTFASLVAVPVRRELWTAVGPPNQHEYQKHTFTPA